MKMLKRRIRALLRGKQQPPNDHWCRGCSPIADKPGETACGGCEGPIR